VAETCNSMQSPAPESENDRGGLNRVTVTATSGTGSNTDRSRIYH